MRPLNKLIIIASAEFLWKVATDKMRTPKYVCLILTHYHADHTFGMCGLKDKGAKIIAHPGVNEFFADDNGRYKTFIARQSEWSQKEADEILGDVKLSAPDKTIEKDTVFIIGGEEFHVLCTPGPCSHRTLRLPSKIGNALCRTYDLRRIRSDNPVWGAGGMERMDQADKLP
jgi:hypothetical protein